MRGGVWYVFLSARPDVGVTARFALWYCGIVVVDLVDGLRALAGGWQVLSQACPLARADADADDDARV